ncbi:MAG: sensor histidine kinase [Chloroflexota bacterium]|nr:MAG: sensor histidine kinase [Chloroflexota bacterium]
MLDLERFRPYLVYILSALMFVAVISRAIPLIVELNYDYLWLAVGLLSIYAVLIATESFIRRRFSWYINIYFLIQTLIIVILLFIPMYDDRTTDFYVLLFIPLCIQAIFDLPRRTSYAWIAGFTLVSVISLLYLYGLGLGLQFGLNYIFAFFFVTMLAVLYLNAEESRKELQEAHRTLQEYSEKAEELATIQERNRLARELHDSVTQALYSLTLYSEAASRELSAGDLDVVRKHLDELRYTSQQALQEMRLLIFELQPPILDRDGLVVALQERLEAVESRTGIKTETDLTLEKRLSSKLEAGLYGIAREALNNILKHAQATQVRVSLSENDELVLLEIEDNGIGLANKGAAGGGGMGIKGMQERANQINASLTLEAKAEGGTLLRVEVPNDGED